MNNRGYADDTTLMTEREEELKSLLMKVKEESEKVGLSPSVSPLTSCTSVVHVIFDKLISTHYYHLKSIVCIIVHSVVF